MRERLGRNDIIRFMGVVKCLGLFIKVIVMLEKFGVVLEVIMLAPALCIHFLM